MKSRWVDGLFLVGSTVVGVVNTDAFGHGWWAYGCLEDWEDVELGHHRTEEAAKAAVEKWVEKTGKELETDAPKDSDHGSADR